MLPVRPILAFVLAFVRVQGKARFYRQLCIVYCLIKELQHALLKKPINVWHAANERPDYS